MVMRRSGSGRRGRAGGRRGRAGAAAAGPAVRIAKSMLVISDRAAASLLEHRRPPLHIVAPRLPLRDAAATLLWEVALIFCMIFNIKGNSKSSKSRQVSTWLAMSGD